MAFQFMLDQLIQCIQIDIGEKLAIEVANRQAPVGGRIEQGLVRRNTRQQGRISPQHDLLGTVMEHQQPGEPESVAIINLRGQQPKQNVLIDGHEVVSNIKLKIPGGPSAIGGSLAQEPLQPFYSGMHAFTLAAGVGVVDEDRLPDAFQIIHQNMMHHPITEVGGEYLAQLGAGGKKADRTGRAVAVILQLRLKLQQVQLLPRLEAQGVVGVPLVPPAVEIVPVEVLKRKQQGKSLSGTNGPGIERIVLIGVALVTVVGIEVPRVVGIGRILGTRPVRVGLHFTHPLSGVIQDYTPPAGNPKRVSRPVSPCLPIRQAGWAHSDIT